MVGSCDGISPDHQFIEAANHFYTKELKAEQRRMLSIVCTSPKKWIFLFDIFSSKVVDGENKISRLYLS